MCYDCVLVGVGVFIHLRAGTSGYDAIALLMVNNGHVSVYSLCVVIVLVRKYSQKVVYMLYYMPISLLVN